MALTQRQKNIINPYPQTIEGSKPFDWYNNLDNKFVLDAIQESYVYFLTFPSIGTLLNGKDRSITSDDYAAYFALYPQNGKIQNNEVLTLAIADSKRQLRNIVQNLRDNNVLEKYTSNTTELVRLPEYEESENIAKLIAIPPNHSSQYRRQLRLSLGLTEDLQAQSEYSIKLLDLSPEVSVFIGSDSNVDLSDWRQNCLPGRQKSRVYYNSIDRNYYFTRRTDSRIYLSYALGFARNSQTAFRYSQEQQQQELSEEERMRQLTQSWDNLANNGAGSAKQNYEEAYASGIKEILKLTGRYSAENAAAIKAQLGVPPTSVVTYWDIRPGSKWCYAVKIPSSVINDLSTTVSEDNRPSYEEDELTPLQKSQILINTEPGETPHNTTSFTAEFKLDDLFRYLVSTRILLREYAEKILDEGITPEIISNISLSNEIESSSTLFNMISEFYSYNKLGMQDDDLIEFCFSEGYGLDHIIINGNFYYRGTGNRIYLSPSEVVAQTLSAFPAATPTTFSIVKNSYDIYLDSKNSTPDTRLPTIDFLALYLYPKVDKEKYKNFILNNSEAERSRLSRRKEMFTVLSRLSQTNPNTFADLWSDRPLSYKASSTLTGINCDTGQMRVAKQALSFWQVATGKTKWRSLIREAVLILRSEIVEDAYAREALRLGAAGLENPDRARREIEMYVDQQISCSLDVVGDFIEKSVLDPMGTPPLANQLLRTTLQQPLKINLKKSKMVSAKSRSSSIYRKMIKAIIMNFIKSIVAGVAKDLISALLGCGPDGDKSPTAELANPMKKYDFGFSDLRDLVEEVDLVSLARNANFDKRPPESPLNITRDQVLSFLKDASEMCTPIELERLLSGDASNEVLQHLLEVQVNNSTHFSVPVSLIQNGNNLDEVVYETINPRAYRHFIITKESLVEFYISLGNSLESLDSLGQLPFNSPLEAYCSKKEQSLVRLRLDASVEDLDNQYFEIVSDKIQRINHLCDWLKDALSMQLEMERLLSNLPTMGWYDDMLNYIANLSQLFADWLAGWWADSVAKPVVSHPIGRYNIYHTRLGQEIIYQCFWALRNIPISEILVHSRSDDLNTAIPAFVTPPNYGGSNDLRFDDEGLSGGAFVQTQGSQTARHVHLFIWNGGDAKSQAESPSAFGPPRLRFPQYRSSPQAEYETWDFSYYSLRNAPQNLENTYYSPNTVPGIRNPPINPTLARVGEERTFLTAIARKNWTYLKDQSQGIGWTGYTWLRCDGGTSPSIRIFFREPDDNGNPRLLSYYNPNTDYYKESSGLSNVGENGDLDDVDYRIFNRLEVPTVHSPTTTISVRDGHTLYVSNGDTEIRLPRLANRDVQRTYANFSVGLPTTNIQTSNPAVGFRARQTAGGNQRTGEQLVSMNNYTIRVDETINRSMFTETQSKRLKSYVKAINLNPFKLSDEDCITAEDKYQADAAVSSIQARLQEFFLNVMPLKTVYLNWGALGTIQLISSYLTTKTLDDLEESDERELFGAWQESYKVIKLVYPHLEDEEYKNNPIIEDNLTPQQTLRNIIEAMYISMLGNLGNTPSHEDLRMSPFDQRTRNYSRYRKTLGYFYRGMVAAIDPAAPIGIEGLSTHPSTERFGITQENSAAVRSLLQQCYILDNGIVTDVTDLGMLLGAYYFPIAFQVASYLMWYDYGLKYAERYQETNHRLLTGKSTADDALLSAIRGQEVTKYSSRYLGFPESVMTWDREELIYRRKRDVTRRLRFLEELPFTGFIGEFTTAYRSVFSDFGDYRFVVARLFIPGTFRLGLALKLYDNETPDDDRTIAGLFNSIRSMINLPALPRDGQLAERDREAYQAWLTAYDNGQVPSFETVYGSNTEFWASYDAPSRMGYFRESVYAAILEEKSQLESLINING